MGDTRLPEGTDSIIGGATFAEDRSDIGSSSGFGATSESSAQASARPAIEEAKAKVGEKTVELRDQAAAKARDYALVGKDRAVEGLDNVQRLISDAADTVEAKVGAQYGTYIRQAADSVASFADLVRDKDVDQLLGDARDLVRKSPAVAIGAAAAIGFVLARVAKAGFDTPTTPVTGGVTPVDPAGTRYSA
jgi:ElaB/YqjD/DUF883 family membrane-anchored ribosome-binding protein